LEYFLNDLLFISGAFSIFDFQIEKGNRSRIDHTLVGFDLLPIEYPMFKANFLS
jgi:hypothetical protein